MGFNMWVIFASLLVALAGANLDDLGPQKFYDVSTDSATSEQNENKEVIVFLTPDQVKALEAGGASVQPTEDDSELLPVPPVFEEQEGDEVNENIQVEEETQEEEESPEDSQFQDIDFDEILRLLNEEEVEEEETTEKLTSNEPQIEEEVTEKPRIFSPRVTLRQQQQPQQEQKYVAPAAAKKEQTLKTYSYIRYQPNEQPQRINVQLLQQADEAYSATEPEQEQIDEAEAPAQERKKYKLVPLDIAEALEENTQQQNSEAEDNAETARKNKLLQDELQAILRELKASPKYNNQKYAIEVERLRNLESLKAQANAAEITKIAPLLIKQQLSKKNRLNKIKQGKASIGDTESKRVKPQQPKSPNNSLPEGIQKSIPVPVIKAEKPEVQKAISVSVDASSKLVSVKNVYVKTRTDRPYIVSRVSENKKLNPVELPTSRPERITILRHIWEQ